MAKKQLTNSEAVLKYVDWLDKNGELEKQGLDRDRIITSSYYAISMLMGLPKYCDMADLYPALTVLLQYIIKNGEDNEARRIRVLQMIVTLTHRALESEHNPIAKILDFKYHKM